jgi:hypothetical protein
VIGLDHAKAAMLAGQERAVTADDEPLPVVPPPPVEDDAFEPRDLPWLNIAVAFVGGEQRPGDGRGHGQRHGEHANDFDVSYETINKGGGGADVD